MVNPEKIWKTFLLCLMSLFMVAGVRAGVDVKLKIHYNDYPLCNWEVRLEHNKSPIGSAVTGLDGVATFNNITLFSKEVTAYLYRLPKDDPDKWNAHGFIRLNEDYTGDLDFGPSVAGGGAPKSALEEAWNIKLYECENLTPEDLHTLPDKVAHVEKQMTNEKKPARNLDKEILDVDDVSFDLEELVLHDHEARIENLNQELEIIEEKRLALFESGEPRDLWRSKIYAAWLEELEMQRQWTDVKLRIVNTQARGQSTVGMMGEEKAFKSRYLSARYKREALQHEARAAVVERDDEKGQGTAFGEKLNELNTALALKKRALHHEQESKNPDAKRMVELNSEIEKLERKIDNLVE